MKQKKKKRHECNNDACIYELMFLEQKKICEGYRKIIIKLQNDLNALKSVKKNCQNGGNVL